MFLYLFGETKDAYTQRDTCKNHTHTNSYESEGMLSFIQAAAMMWAFVVCDVSFTRLSILAYPSGGAIVRPSHIGGGNGSFHTV